jgi:hypothetical protein
VQLEEGASEVAGQAPANAPGLQCAQYGVQPILCITRGLQLKLVCAGLSEQGSNAARHWALQQGFNLGL